MTDYDSDWHPRDVEDALQSEGYDEFTEVLVEDRKLKVCCTCCGMTITANEKHQGLSGFKQHLTTAIHQKNARITVDHVDAVHTFLRLLPHLQAAGANNATDSSVHGPMRMPFGQHAQAGTQFEQIFRPPDQQTNCTTAAATTVRARQWNPFISNNSESRLDYVTYSDWQVDYIQKELRKEGYANFTAVMTVDKLVMIHCIYCNENINANDCQRGLDDFLLHLVTDKHLQNVQNEYEAECGPIATRFEPDPQPASPAAYGFPNVPASHGGALPHHKVDRGLGWQSDGTYWVKKAPTKAEGSTNRMRVDAPIHHGRGKCVSGKICHMDAPSQWQFLDDDTGVWTDMPDNQTIENNYCQVENDTCFVIMEISTSGFDKTSAMGEIHFNDGDDMTVTFQNLKTPMKVRRHTPPTASSTKWKWYWLDEKKVWKEYGSQSNKNVQSKANAEDIENAYHSASNFQFTTTEGQRYDIDYSRMVQRNIQYKTERKVRRRPVFIEWTKKATNYEKAPKKDQSLMASYIPEYWDRHKNGEHVKYVKLERYGKTGQEYQRIEALIKFSLPLASLTSIKRVQSLEVFDAYDRKKTWMKKAKEMDPKELHLFHGTKTASVKTICEQGFDCRISGSRTGTKYGKGTYFGATAAEASKYAENVMFVCKVLVGDSCQGRSEYVRPPPRDPRKSNENLYDSCVDDPAQPTMYIIFKSEQAYPQYIIEYEFV